MHHVIIYENDQQDATVKDNLLFLGCSTCFERYFRSSSGVSKLYLQLLLLHTYVTAGWYQPAATYVCNTRSCKYSLDAPDDERKHRSKHVEQARNNKFSYTVASCWSLSRNTNKMQLVIEFIIPKFSEGSTYFERHTAHHQEL